MENYIYIFFKRENCDCIIFKKGSRLFFTPL